MSIKFETNVPVAVYFPFGDFREKESQFGGMQFLYTAKMGGPAGVQDFLYASEALQGVLQQFALKGNTLNIIKKEEGKQKYWLVTDGKVTISSLTPGSAQSAPPAGAEPPLPNEPPPEEWFDKPPQQGVVQPGSPIDNTLDTAALATILSECLAAASWAWKEARLSDPPTTEDVRALGITLFLESRRSRK